MEEFSKQALYFSAGCWKLGFWGGGSWCGWKELKPPGRLRAASASRAKAPPGVRMKMGSPCGSCGPWQLCSLAALLPGCLPGKRNSYGFGESRDSVKTLAAVSVASEPVWPCLRIAAITTASSAVVKCYSPGSRVEISSWSVEKKNLQLSL